MLNLLIIVYNALPWADMGIAIIIVTILIRLLLFPLAQKSTRAQIAMQGLQPQIDTIREKHKDDKQAQTQKVMEFYKENKVNPLGSCLPLLLQLPIIFALYQVFRTGLSVDNLGALYDFVPPPETLNTVFLGVMDLETSSIALAVIAGAFQFVQTKMLATKNKKTKKVQKSGEMPDIGSMMSTQMTYFMPVMTIFIGATLPAALTLYWVVVTIFAIFQQYFLQKKYKTEQNGK